MELVLALGFALAVVGCTVVESADTGPHYDENGNQCGVCQELFYNDISVSCNQAETDLFVTAFECICNDSCADLCGGLCVSGAEVTAADDPCLICMNAPKSAGGCLESWKACAGNP